MKKLTLAALIALCSTPVLAQQGGFNGPGSQNVQQTQQTQQGGFSGPSASLTTVDKVKSMSDDAWVMLQGNIEQRVGDDTYTFRDATGTLTVEIDHKRWNGQTITPKDKVQLEGKVDKDWSNLELDVKNIKKIQ
ncbi:MAG: YgiW/YdeI family stress tolerance OB fold protein [Serratia rubidaea]|nr:YgiW/YdeI family stress tolerance OB fold protein [Serratia rubidaea]QPT12281.1 YgiW/YdeI family stress tolerance OB fold protein [Serratia rubidaea]